MTPPIPVEPTNDQIQQTLVLMDAYLEEQHEPSSYVVENFWDTIAEKLNNHTNATNHLSGFDLQMYFEHNWDDHNETFTLNDHYDIISRREQRYWNSVRAQTLEATKLYDPSPIDDDEEEDDDEDDDDVAMTSEVQEEIRDYQTRVCEFPVMAFHRRLQQELPTLIAATSGGIGHTETNTASTNTALTVSSDASAFLAATLEYVVAEILELSGNECRDHRHEHIESMDLEQAIKKDDDLSNHLVSQQVMEHAFAPPTIPPCLRMESSSSSQRPLLQIEVYYRLCGRNPGGNVYWDTTRYKFLLGQSSSVYLTYHANSDGNGILGHGVLPQPIQNQLISNMIPIKAKLASLYGNQKEYFPNGCKADWYIVDQVSWDEQAPYQHWSSVEMIVSTTSSSDEDEDSDDDDDDVDDTNNDSSETVTSMHDDDDDNNNNKKEESFEDTSQNHTVHRFLHFKQECVLGSQYNGADWSTPDDDEENFLVSGPAREELKQVLDWVSTAVIGMGLTPTEYETGKCRASNGPKSIPSVKYPDGIPHRMQPYYFLY